MPYALDQRSQLTLLTVVPDPPRAVIAAGVSPQQMAQEMESQAERHLRHVTATLPRELSVTTVLRHGDPAEEILALVRAQPVDLICMGARCRSSCCIPRPARARRDRLAPWRRASIPPTMKCST